MRVACPSRRPAMTPAIAGRTRPSAGRCRRHIAPTAAGSPTRRSSAACSSSRQRLPGVPRVGRRDTPCVTERRRSGRGRRQGNHGDHPIRAAVARPRMARILPGASGRARVPEPVDGGGLNPPAP